MRSTITFIITFVLLVVGVVISLFSGQLGADFSDVIKSIFSGPFSNDLVSDALWQIRFPRIAMALSVGAALAISGLLMQAIFGNPLAEPGVVGVSAGAAVGAALVIATGLSALSPNIIPFAAFMGGLGATLIVYFLSRSEGKTEVVTLILTGIAVNACAGALIAVFTFMAETSAREQIVFWQLGSVNGAKWEQVALIAPVVTAGFVFAILLSKELDILSLGERSARHLGIRVERLRILIILLVATMVGVSVAFTGIIAFVGLVVPHLMRLILGPSHFKLLFASALGGSVLLLYADLLSRTLIENADIPIGIFTALIGGPFFFWLLRVTRKKSGGWA